MKKRVIGFFGVLLMVVSLLLVGSNLFQINKTVTITLGVFAGSNWDVPNGDCYRIFEDAIRYFEKNHPNVKVEMVSGIVKENYVEWISQQAILKKVPDVIMVPSEDFSMFAQTGILLNLDAYIKNDRNFDLYDFYTPSREAGVYQGSQYALPFESVPTLMYVNKTLLEREGIPLPDNNWTWEEFYQICDQVTKDRDGDGILDQFGVYGYDWLSAAHSNNASLFNQNGEITLTSDAMEESVRFVKKLNALNQNIEITAQDFDEGKVAFCPMKFSEYRAYKPYPWRVKKYSNFEWDCLMLPAGINGDNTSEITTLSMGISSHSQNKRYAWEFLKTLTYDETIQKELFSVSQGVSVLKKVTESEDVIQILMQDNPGDSTFQMRMLSEVMEKGSVSTYFTGYEEIISRLDAEMYRIINDGNGDIEDELNTLQQKCQTYMKE